MLWPRKVFITGLRLYSAVLAPNKILLRRDMGRGLGRKLKVPSIGYSVLGQIKALVYRSKMYTYYYVLD